MEEKNLEAMRNALRHIDIAQHYVCGMVGKEAPEHIQALQGGTLLMLQNAANRLYEIKRAVEKAEEVNK